MSEALDRLASALFGAIERGDLDAVRELYAPDVQVWLNVTGRNQDREGNLALLRAFTSRVSERRYEVLSREFFPGGFVQRHVLRGKLAGGDPLAAHACLVVYVAGGRIERLFEYVDAAAVSPIFA